MKLQSIISYNNPVFNGLSKISLNTISNIITLNLDQFILINFTIDLYLSYNSTVPIIENQTQVIQQVQQKSLSQCIFNSSVTVNSISTPLLINTNVKLNTGGSRKKRQTDSSDCDTNQQIFASVCSNTKQLTSCNQEGLENFLKIYINQTVLYF